MTDRLRERVGKLVSAWREDWDRTRPVTRVVLGVLGVVALAWLVFALAFALRWRL